MKSNIFIPSFILLLIVIINPWTQRIFQETSMVNIFLIFFIILALFVNTTQSNRRWFYSAILVNSILIILTLPKHIDTKIFKQSKLEQDTLIRMYDNYALGIGKLYMNRYGIYYHYKIEPIIAKFEENLFENMDINGYFFASHPREKGGFNEYLKFYPIFLPFFLLGFISIMIKNKDLLFLFIGNLIFSSLYIYNGSPWQMPLYPYFILFIYSGINICLKKLYQLPRNH